jgi:hypothetical protein
METNREFSSVVEVPQFPGASVVTRSQAAEDPHEATAQTIDRMKAWAARDASTPQVFGATHQALLLSGDSELDRCSAVLEWIRSHCKFREDDPVLRICLNLENELELLITPARLLTMTPPRGDCDCLTTLCMSMLACAGIRSEPVTIKADPDDPSRDSHVYCQALLEDGSAVVIDAAMCCKFGFPLGWEAPDYWERETWGAVEPVAQSRGMNGYTGLAGLGQSGEVPVETGGDSVLLGTDVTGTQDTAPIVGTPFNWAGLVTALGSDATRIAQLATLPQGYTLNAAGQPVAVGAAALSSSAMLPLLLIGGGLLLIVALKK